MTPDELFRKRLDRNEIRRLETLLAKTRRELDTAHKMLDQTVVLLDLRKITDWEHEWVETATKYLARHAKGGANADRSASVE